MRAIYVDNSYGKRVEGMNAIEEYRKYVNIAKVAMLTTIVSV